MTKRLIARLKKTIASATAAAMVATTPGSMAFAQPVQVNAPVVQGGAPVVGGVNGVNPGTGGNNAGQATGSGNHLNGGMPGSNFGKRGFVSPAPASVPSATPPNGRGESLTAEESTVGDRLTTEDTKDTEAPEVTPVEAIRSADDNVVITNADAKTQPTLNRLSKPSVVKQLPPQASVEQAYDAGNKDFSRITGEKYRQSRDLGNAPKAKIRRVEDGSTAPSQSRQTTGGTALPVNGESGKAAGKRSDLPALPAVTRTESAPSALSAVAQSPLIKEAVKAWEREVALDASGFAERTAMAGVKVIAEQLGLKDAVGTTVSPTPAAFGGHPAQRAGESSANRRSAESAEKIPASERSADSASSASSAVASDASAVPQGFENRQNRSVMFPAVATAVMTVSWAAMKAVPALAGWTTPVAGGTAVQPIDVWYHFFTVGATALAFTVGAFIAWTMVEFALYGVMKVVGKGVTPAEASAFLRSEAKHHPDLYRGLLGVRPGTGILKFAFDKQVQPFGVFAFTLPNAIYLRPELVRIPWLFRLVLRHELHHFKHDLGRAPPAKGVLGKVRSVVSEAGAHLFELFPRSGRLPQGYLLERVLTQAQTSLRLTSSYDVLLAARETNAIGASDFKWISEGKARVRTLRATDSDKLAQQTREALRDPANKGKFRALLLDDVKGWLPKGAELKSLEMAFRRMEQVYQEKVLQQRAKPLALSSKKEPATAPDLWSQVRTPNVEKLELVRFFDDLYNSLQDKGVALLPFAPGDPSLGPVEKMFRHWANSDKGYFRTTRVDLAEGGHVLVAIKSEPRVRVYLKPTNGAKVASSVDSVYRDPVKRAAADAVLKHIGLEQWLPTFREIGLEVVHIQGEDTGDTMVYVSVPRKNLRYVERLVTEKSVEVVKSENKFEVHGFAEDVRSQMPEVRNHLHQAVPRQNAAEAWKAVGGAKGIKVYSDDTGAWAAHPYFGGRVTAEDVTDEGPEDWHGHGTQTIGDALSGDKLKGPAYEATGVMVKVFPKGSGASDGDIRAGWGKSQQGGGDVLFMSLGSQGSPDTALSRDASALTRRKNSKGHYPIVIASAGNSGPDAETVGQPSAGEEVISVAAATKGEDPNNPSKDAKLEVSLYSSAGWSWSSHGYGLTRPVLKPEITGEVGTVNHPDEKGDVYKYGLTSPRSKDAEPSPSDSSDGLETRAAGTSMSAPQAAGLAALLKKALNNLGDKLSTWTFDNLPFTVKMIMMVTAEDMRAPVQKMGAGLMDFGAAVKAASGDLEWVKDARKAVDLPRQVFETAAAAGKETDGVVRGSPEAQLKARIAARSAARKVLTMFPKQFRDKARLVARQAAIQAAEKSLAQEVGNAAAKSAAAALKREISQAMPELKRLLKHDVWVVRFYAAHAFLGLKDADSVGLLAEVAVNDKEARVRQLALQAIAETNLSRGQWSVVREGVKARLNDETVEIRAYAALAIARQGDPGDKAEALTTLVEMSKSTDKMVRYTASWAMGYIGKAADTSVTEALASIAAKATERDSNRHEAVAALGRLVSNEEAFTPKVFEDVLSAAGTHELIMTRTVLNSFFAKAAQDREMRRLMTSEPAKRHLVAFVEKHRAAALKRGGLGDLVRLLARLTGVELGSPAPIDPSGQGVPGVDDNLGPVHVLVEVPEGKKINRTVLTYQDSMVNAQGEDATAVAMNEQLTAVEFPMDVVSTLGGSVRSVMKEGFVAIEIPAYSVPAFAQQMQLKGFLVSRATPKYMFLKDTGPLNGIPALHGDGITGVGTVGLVIDEGLDTDNPAFKGKILGTVNTSGDGKSSTDVTDESVGHGTHTGNIAAGSQREDGNPNIGRAPGAFVIAAKVLGRAGGSEATVMEGVSAAVQIVDDVNAKLAEYWAKVDALPGSTGAHHEVPQPEGEALRNAIKQGIRRFVPALNLSLGGPGRKNSPLNVQLRRLHLDGGAMVNVAAGNDGPGEGTANETSPANEWSIKTIGSLKKDGKLVFYSSRGTKSDPMRILGHYGGDADLEGSACPFLPGGIVSALAAKAAREVASCIVPHKGKPTDQAMSGTSMASPHSNGDDLLLLQAFRKIFSDQELAAMKGWTLWLDELAFASMGAVPGTQPHEVRGRRDIRAELAALAERGKDKAKIAAEAQELYEKAKERDTKEAGLRWAGVGGPGPFGSVGVWKALWEAFKSPIQKGIERLVKRQTKNGMADIPRSRDLAEHKALREIMNTGGSGMTPFVFHHQGRVLEAPAAGLEGYFYTKSRIESHYGPDAVLHQLQDSFSYLHALLATQAWARPVREELDGIAADPAKTPSEKNAALNRLIGETLVVLRARVAAIDHAAWSRDARVYEFFPRAYNLRDKRLAGSRWSRFKQTVRDRLEATGLRKPKPFFADITVADLKDIKALGFDAVWSMGVHPIGLRNRWGTAGGSPYSISDYESIHADLGTMEDYRGFVKKAHKAGLKVIADFVPNHSSMDSKLLAAHPEYFVHKEAGAGDPPKGWFAYEQPGTGKKYWIHHGGYDSYGRLETWTDTAQVDYSREDTRAAMAAAAKSFAKDTGIDGYRVDMAYQILNAPFSRLWHRQTPRREFLEQLATDLKTLKPSFALIAEAYAHHDQLSAAGIDVIYNKSDTRRYGQEGFYDALVGHDGGRSAATLERALRRVAFQSWQKGGATGIQFSTNHDEAAPARAFGKWMKAALFLSMLLPGAQLVYGSQEIGYDAPGPNEPKSIPFEVPRKIDWLNADTAVRDFYGQLFRQQIRMRKALKSPEMTVLDGDGKWVGYTLSSRESDTVFAVLANPSGSPVDVKIDRPDLGIQYAATLRGDDAIVVSFPAPTQVSLKSKVLRSLSSYPKAAQLLSSAAFFAFLPMMIPQIQNNWTNYQSGNLEALKGISAQMMALGITGNLLNFSAFLMSKNPWFIVGCFFGIVTSWIALLPLYFAGLVDPALFIGGSIAGATFLTSTIVGYFLHSRK